MFNQMKSLSRT